jgi:XTP/dITP diphosphohydrolase
MTEKAKIKVVLATGNQGKAREFRALLEPLGYEIVLQSELGIKSPEETGLSFIENALIKARHAAKESSLMAIADDSGLCVDALNGAPGIYSARYSGEHGDDKANNRKLLEELKKVKADKRTARYCCALALVRSGDDPVPLIVQESWEGAIGFEERGQEGFGYDPLFLVKGRKLTAAQLPPQTKNLMSHRGKALQKLVYELEHA